LPTSTAVSVINKGQLLKKRNIDLEARRLVLGAIEVALPSVDPQRLVKKHVRVDDDRLLIDGFTIGLSKVNRILVVGGGKASAAMAEALFDVLGSRITKGIITVPKYQKQEFNTGSIELVGAGHPIPTVEADDAVSKMLELVGGLNERDLVFCLLSGGGSALMASPMKGIGLEEKQSITKALLKSGASINELNIVRKHISNVKGGRMAQKIYPAEVIGLIISDVVGDPLETIASGPTYPDPSTFKDAVETLKRYNIWEPAPEAIRRTLENGENGMIPESPKPENRIFEKVHNFIIGRNELACEAALKYLKSNDIDASILTTFLEGEAREVGRTVSSIARYVRSRRREARGVSIILGGETTVTVKGDGKGGRNQEFALSACRFIGGVKGLAIATIGTDGIDGFTDSAGGIVDSHTLSRAKEAGLDVESFLQNNDSNSFLEKLGDTIITGPTGTNVNDIVIAVRTESREK